MMETPKAVITLKHECQVCGRSNQTLQHNNQSTAQRQTGNHQRELGTGPWANAGTTPGPDMIHSYWHEEIKKDEAASGTPVIG